MAADGRLPLDKLSGAGAKAGDTAVWTGTRWVPGPGGGLYVSTLADGPPTDGSVFWYVTDESC